MEEVNASSLEKALLCVYLSGLPFDLGIFHGLPGSYMGREVRCWNYPKSCFPLSPKL